MALKKILAIETSGRLCSAALCTFDARSVATPALLPHINSIDFETIAEYNIHRGNQHDKYCAELCRRILQDNETTVGALDGVAVSAGPGSFTGLRIGMSVAKGLCFDKFYTTEDRSSFDVEIEERCPQLLVVSTLSAIATNGLGYVLNYESALTPHNHSDFLAVIPSHANLVYHQLFYKDGTPKTEISFSEISSLSTLFENKNIWVGTNYKTKIDFGFYLPPFHNLTAIAVAKVGAIQFINKQFADVASVQPFYIQDFTPRV